MMRYRNSIDMGIIIEIKAATIFRWIRHNTKTEAETAEIVSIVNITFVSIKIAFNMTPKK